MVKMDERTGWCADAAVTSRLWVSHIYLFPFSQSTFFISVSTTIATCTCRSRRLQSIQKYLSEAQRALVLSWVCSVRRTHPFFFSAFLDSVLVFRPSSTINETNEIFIVDKMRWRKAYAYRRPSATSFYNN